MRTVTVIGSGVIGLSCASVLTDRGFAVTVVSRDPVLETTSWAAASLWAPTAVERSERVRLWAYRSLAEFRRLASDPAAGIREQQALTIGAAPWEPDPWMRGFAAPIRAARKDELPAGYGAGVVSAIPLIDTSRYLPWLAARCRSAGVVFERKAVERLSDAAPAGTPIVLATGFGAAALAADPTLRPVRGQIVRLSNPGLTETLMVRDGADAPLFVVPRVDDVIVGGPSQDGVGDPLPDLVQEREVLERACTLVPALREARVLDRAVGHRPVRDTVRVERDILEGAEVVHCYGHGGAGIATSWGSALAAADLIEEIV